MYSIIYSQGKFVHKDGLQFPMEERGLQFGDGVYEVIRIYGNKPYLLGEHIARLFRSLKAIRIEVVYNEEQIKKNLYELIERNNVNEDSFIYLQITRGSAERSHPFPKEATPNIYAYLKPYDRQIETREKGVKTITHRDERWENCYIKSLNLLPNVLAQQVAVEQGAYEAILHQNHIVTECSSSNVFIVKDGTIYTHPANNRILNGCVRMAILRLAKSDGIPVVEEAFTLDDLLQANEIFLTSSLCEVMAIVQVDDSMVANGLPGPISRRLQLAYEKDANLR